MPESINTRQIGNFGEKAAVEFLKKAGYTIIETNWRAGKLEIDIIASTTDTLVFVEVKTRASSGHGEPEEFVTQKKQKHIISAANFYLRENNIKKEARFDIIAILEDNNTPVVKHLPDAFRAWAG